jgi:hypothetical protein
MRAINVLITLFVSLVIAVLIFEGGLRLIGFSPPKSLNDFDSVLGWSKKKDAKVKRSSPEFKITFETNDEGLRDDPELRPAKPAGVFRVVMLGDSFVLGYTVDRKDLFVDELEGWWKSEERRVEIVNGGTEGYSTDQEALWFREHGAAYSPDVVVIFPYLNDIYWNGEARYGRYPQAALRARRDARGDDPHRPGQDALPAAPGARQVPGLPQDAGPPRRTRAASSPRAPPGRSSGSSPRCSSTSPTSCPTPWRARAGRCSRSRRTAPRPAPGLFVCPIPPETAIHKDEHDDFAKKYLGKLPDEAWDPMKPVNDFLALATELGLETMDPRQALQTRAEAGERLYFDAEWHFNPAGNAALTDFLYKEFENRAVLPPEHRALRQGGIPEHKPEGGFPTWLAVFGALWVVLTTLYLSFYRDEPLWQPPLKVAGMLALVFTIVLGGGKLVRLLPPGVSQVVLILFVIGILGFVAYKLGRRLGTILELLKSFTLRGTGTSCPWS